MEDYKLLVYSNAAPGCDAEFNAWYDDVHLGEVLQIEGITAAVRYDVLPKGEADELKHRYLTVYEMSAQDPRAILAELSRRAQSGVFQMSDSLADPMLVLVKQRS